jgi:hypothetical protein
MLVDSQGNKLDAVRKADHWRMFEALLQYPAVATPLRNAVNSYVAAAVADHRPRTEKSVDSTAAGPQVFSRLGGQWTSDYTRWHADMCSQRPENRAITAEQIYGMMLWYVLAADRSERWLAPPQGEKRVYKLLEPEAASQATSPERQMLLVLRQTLRDQLAKLDEFLGDA